MFALYLVYCEITKFIRNRNLGSLSWRSGQMVSIALSFLLLLFSLLFLLLLYFSEHLLGMPSQRFPLVLSILFNILIVFSFLILLNNLILFFFIVFISFQLIDLTLVLISLIDIQVSVLSAMPVFHLPFELSVAFLHDRDHWSKFFEIHLLPIF